MRTVPVSVGLLRWLRSNGFEPAKQAVFIYLLLHHGYKKKGEVQKVFFPSERRIERDLGVDRETVRATKRYIELHSLFQSDEQMEDLGRPPEEEEGGAKRFFGLLSWQELAKVLELLRAHNPKGIWPAYLAYIHLTTYARKEDGKPSAVTRAVRKGMLETQMDLQRKEKKKGGKRGSTWVYRLINRLVAAKVIARRTGPEPTYTLIPRLETPPVEEGALAEVVQIAQAAARAAPTPAVAPAPAATTTPPAGTPPAAAANPPTPAPSGTRTTPYLESSKLDGMPEDTPAQRIAKRDAVLAYKAWAKTLVRFQDLDPLYQPLEGGPQNRYYQDYKTAKEEQMGTCLDLMPKLDQYRTYQEAETANGGTLTSGEKLFFSRRYLMLRRHVPAGRGVPYLHPGDEPKNTKLTPLAPPMTPEYRMIYRKLVLDEWVAAHNHALGKRPKVSDKARADADALVRKLEEDAWVSGEPTEEHRLVIQQLFTEAGRKVIESQGKRKMMTISWVTLILDDLLGVE